ncbi:hypothetical protein HMPREF1992_02301, partial [Selenomonas sp. oral taxon 892 str. F0426]
RAPHGARGLKHEARPHIAWDVLSRPTRGAWIETEMQDEKRADEMSRLAWGAWIETDSVLVANAANGSRPAWGAWIETDGAKINIDRIMVAPRMGRVD